MQRKSSTHGEKCKTLIGTSIYWRKRNRELRENSKNQGLCKNKNRFRTIAYMTALKITKTIGIRRIHK